MGKINKKFEIGLLIVLVLLSFIGAVYSVFALNVSDLNYYSYTTAICSGNSCADFLVECNGNEIVSNSQITGWITFSENWEDPRGESGKEFCN